ncbi:MAG: hypothetical protein AAGK02_01960 [Pseudomonadota bacterium]
MTIRTVAKAIAALSVTLLGPIAQANEQHWTATPEGYAAHLSKIGAWQFSALKRNAEGQPECIETWTFAGDGSGTLVSGEQTIILSWRYVKDDIFGMVLRINYESSTSGKDCMGYEVDPAKYPRDNGTGFELLFLGGGERAYVCNAPQASTRIGEDGKPITLQSMENCWGNLEPAVSAQAQG